MTIQLCTFGVGKLFMGVAIDQVQEILRAQTLTRVPLAPSVMRGLMNLRGQIVPAIDLRERLSIVAENGEEAFHVLVRTADGPVSLIVDHVGDVIEVEAESFEPAPEGMPYHLRRLIRGAYKLEQRLLLALDAMAAAQLEA